MNPIVIECVRLRASRAEPEVHHCMRVPFHPWRLFILMEPVELSSQVIVESGRAFRIGALGEHFLPFLLLRMLPRPAVPPSSRPFPVVQSPRSATPPPWLRSLPAMPLGKENPAFLLRNSTGYVCKECAWLACLRGHNQREGNTCKARIVRGLRNSCRLANPQKRSARAIAPGPDDGIRRSSKTTTPASEAEAVRPVSALPRPPPKTNIVPRLVHFSDAHHS